MFWFQILSIVMFIGKHVFRLTQNDCQEKIAPFKPADGHKVKVFLQSIFYRDGHKLLPLARHST